MSQPEPLHLSVHSLQVPDLDQRRAAVGRLKMLIILLVCAAPVVASYVAYYWVRPQTRSNYGSLIEPQQALPEAAALALKDLNGRSVAPASLRGQWLLIVVAGGQCDARCEKQLYAQRQLREMLGKDRLRMDRVWLVDDDQPVRAALLPALAGASVLRVQRQQLSAWLRPEPQQLLESHLYLVDPLGNWMMRFPVQADPYKVKRDLDKLMRASASWDREGRESQAAPGEMR